jgi:hypothetical protein
METKINEEFFAKAFDNRDEFVIHSSDVLNLYFGADGIRCFKFNDVVIMPSENTTINISLKTKNKKIFDIQIKERTVIKQRPSEENYPCFVLHINEEKYTHPNICSGTLTIDGNCVITQTPAYFSN